MTTSKTPLDLPPVPPPARSRTLTVRVGAALAVAMLLANASNYVFQAISGRFLGPEEYGLLSSIFTLIIVLGVATSSLQAAFAKAEVAKRHEPVVGRSAWGIDDPIIRLVVVGALGVGLLVAAASPFLGHFFHSTATPIAFFVVLVPAVALLSVVMGRLQGRERFFALGVLAVSTAGGKLVLGGLALAVGLGVSSIVGSITLVTVIAAGAGLWLTRGSATPTDQSVFSDLARALVALALFRLLVGIDVPLARHWLPEVEAGQYAAAAVIGKSILFLPDVVALIVFPELAASVRAGKDVRHLLRRAVAVTTGVCVVGTIGLLAVGEVMFKQVFGSEYVDAAPIAWKLALVSTPLALANLFIYFHVAGSGSRWLLWPAAILTGQVLLLVWWHSTLDQFVVATAAAAIVLAAVLGYLAFRSRPPSAAPEPLAAS